MNGFLLDTNVVSEIVKPLPERRVIEFLTEQSNLWLSVIVFHEMKFGLDLLPQGNRRRRLSVVLSSLFSEYDDRILPVDRPEADNAAVLRAEARKSGQTLNLADALIAGTAKTHGLCVATRNVGDFDGLEVDVTNPWQRPQPTPQ